jgi:hypothetical protein
VLGFKKKKIRDKLTHEGEPMKIGIVGAGVIFSMGSTSGL